MYFALAVMMAVVANGAGYGIADEVGALLMSGETGSSGRGPVRGQVSAAVQRPDVTRPRPDVTPSKFQKACKDEYYSCLNYRGVPNFLDCVMAEAAESESRCLVSLYKNARKIGKSKQGGRKTDGLIDPIKTPEPTLEPTENLDDPTPEPTLSPTALPTSQEYAELLEMTCNHKTKRNCSDDPLCYVYTEKSSGQKMCLKEVCLDEDHLSYKRIKTATECLEAIGMGYCDDVEWEAVDGKKAFKGCRKGRSG